MFFGSIPAGELKNNRNVTEQVSLAVSSGKVFGNNTVFSEVGKTFIYLFIFLVRSCCGGGQA